jgi:hypothetical protein
MTKGVPANPRICHRCGLSYHPASGPQKYCNRCHPTMRFEYNKNWRTSHPNQRRLINKRAIANKPEYYRALKRYAHYRWREKLWQAVFAHYSNNTFICACCGESEKDFLVIDHINGNGNQHRREVLGTTNAGGYRMHRWLVKTGFPPGFQVLCSNCNTSKGKHDECIHKKMPMVPRKPIPTAS